MMDELNPEKESARTTGSATDDSVNALSQALEKLLERAPGSATTSGSITGLPAPAVACPGPGEWLALAIGEARPKEADALLAHAAGCAACASRLRRSVRLLNENASTEETAEAAGLASASAGWRHTMAVELAHTPHRSRRGSLLGWPVWAGAALAASLTLALGLTLWWQHMNTPERLMAEAYTHSRIFELRMPGAGFAAVTPEAHLRGSATGRESSKLLDARARIERHLESEPGDPHWLQLEARADLLEEKYDAAVDILDRLLAAGPVTSSLLADDASAYFQRGAATGSENDRATALDYLRRADELTPADPVVLFNEAIAMEDRGQVMNAVETWNRYLRFERNPQWQAEGRRRLQALEQKLNQLKTHQSRMDSDLATPQAMRALAADATALGAIDEELSSNLLPRLIDSAFGPPMDRSCGAPCDEKCQAARILLHALSNSLERNHQDPWLTRLLPAASSAPSAQFIQAAQALARAIDADLAGDYLSGRKLAADAQRSFRSQGNAAGKDRAQLELSYALGRSSDHPACYAMVHPLLGRNKPFEWIQTFALMQDELCSPAVGTAGENDPVYRRAIGEAHDHGYTTLELRARNLLGAAAVDSGDAEVSWRIYLPSIRMFYAGDYPPLRLYNILSGLAEIEASTPRVQHALLLQREVLGVLELTSARQLIPTERFKLAGIAIRAGSVTEAQSEMRQAKSELAANGGGESVKGYLAEDEMAMANFYLAHHDLPAASKMLDSAGGHIAGGRNTYHTREFAVAQGELELAEGHPENVEPLLRDALVEEERVTLAGGAENITFAQQDRDLYAVLAAVWLAQGRPGEDILALWERYRLRILGKPLLACPNQGLACLQPSLASALGRLGPDQVAGQIVLLDRTLLFRADTKGVEWTSTPIGKDDVLAAEAALERAASSPATSQESVDQAARRVGSLLFDPLRTSPRQGGQLLIEQDPLLGNLPWPAAETSSGPIGLQYDLAEAPSLLLAPRPARLTISAVQPNPLVVGASLALGDNKSLPEVLDEAKAVARFGRNPKVLLAGQATQDVVSAGLVNASAFHFAGHAVEEGGTTKLLLAAPSAGHLAGSSASATADKPYIDSEILRRHPPRFARLAVFSACSSGKREEGWNHGMGDIVDTLTALGVPEVVATRWQIDSGSAVPMMDAFYGGLARGLSVPHALMEARQTLTRDPRYRHPYYWAAYYASSSGRPDLRGVFQAAK